MIPNQYTAKDLKGNTVTGYFVMLHLPVFSEDGYTIVGFEEKPHLFNDERGERNDGGYWHEIEINTLKPKQTQLNLFDE